MSLLSSSPWQASRHACGTGPATTVTVQQIFYKKSPFLPGSPRPNVSRSLHTISCHLPIPVPAAVRTLKIFFCVNVPVGGLNCFSSPGLGPSILLSPRLSLFSSSAFAASGSFLMVSTTVLATLTIFITVSLLYVMTTKH